MTFPPGTLVAGRFSVMRLAGRGGMGSVYQARDTSTGQTVALKLMHAPGPSVASRRFQREAQVLSALRHPGIVSYVAHGVTDDGQPFLAMEWLEGEDLSRRLGRQPLHYSEVLLLLRRAAEALAEAHERYIIHRDIKPSNLFLHNGRVEELKLLDFGLARVEAASERLTNLNVVGTPAYMAPEQASTQADITPAADIFSLGCVVYECLTGQTPFHAPHVAAIMAKILYAEPQPLGTLRPELPSRLQELVDRMLAKDPSRRISDGQQLMRELGAMGNAHPRPSQDEPAPMPAGMTDTEQQLVSVLLAAPKPASREDTTLTLGEEESARGRMRLESLLQPLREMGAEASLLANGSLLATFRIERGTAEEQAKLAAHSALHLKESWPESLTVLTTGLSLRGTPLPVGQAMDRAGELLHRVERRPEAASRVVLDGMTAQLLEPYFQFEQLEAGAFLLLSEHRDVDQSRRLIGRPTPFVGREQDLGWLALTYESCVEERSASAVLVTAPAGIGKSRLRHEFLRHLERYDTPPLVLLGRGDPMSAGSAYSLLGYAVRKLCDVVDGEPLEKRRERLSQRVRSHQSPQQQEDTVVFLGELCGVPFPPEEHPRLAAARQDPRLLSQQVTRAMVEFLRAELSQGPVLLVLEDLHWGDVPTVRLVDEALAELSDSPLMVMALARPEVKELFPRLWSRWLQELPLRGLSKTASTRLVQEVVGSQLPASVVARLVEQAAGNALFLEELIRAVVEGRGEETPGTIMAMLQSRVQRLETRPRRVLLAGAIFGRNFWSGGVRALVNEDMSPEELERCLRHLVEQELVQRQVDSRFPQEIEYRFRHALMRDAAYSLVPDNIKPRNHRLAAAWLEKNSEHDPLVLAEHYLQGQDKQRASYLFARAAERLIEQQDPAGGQRWLKAALECEPTGVLRVELKALDAILSFWLEDFERAYTLGRQVRPELTPGTVTWGRIMGALMLMAAQSGRPADMLFLAQIFLSTTPAPNAVSFYIQAASYLSIMHSWYGQPAQATTVLERMDQVSSTMTRRDGMAQGWLYAARGFFDHFHQPRPWQCLSWAEQGTQAFNDVNRNTNQSVTQTLRGLALVALGDVPAALATMNEGLANALRYGLTPAINYTQVNLALVLANSPELPHHSEARQMAQHILKTERTNVLHLGLARLVLAKVGALEGQLSTAEAEARKACEVLVMFAPYQLMARATLCAVLLAQKRPQDARAEAEQGVRVLERLGNAGAVSVGTWLALAEACFAQEDTEAAERALREAVRCMRLRASDIPEPAARERFLSRVPENARTRALALERWGPDWESASAAT
jgi:tetratricopeptide (TPR) repeat protein